MVERRVFFHDVGCRHFLGQQHRPQNLVRGPGIHVVGPEQIELLEPAPLLAHQIFHRRHGLLVRRRAGVEDIARTFFSLVLHGIEQQAVVLLEDRQHRLAADRGPAAEDDRHLILQQELLGLFGKEVPVRGRIDDDRLDHPAHHPALGVDFFDCHHHGVPQRHFADRHGAAERVQDADLDRFLVRRVGQGPVAQVAKQGGNPYAGRYLASFNQKLTPRRASLTRSNLVCFDRACLIGFVLFHSRTPFTNIEVVPARQHETLLWNFSEPPEFTATFAHVVIRWLHSNDV